MVDGSGCQVNNLFGSICSLKSRWSKFKLVYVSVVDVYSVGFCILYHL